MSQDTAQSAFAQSIAVVIAVDSYANGIAPLRTPVADANAVGALLASRHGFEVREILDQAATVERLRALLAEELPSLVQPDSRLMVYFAGHGVAADGDDGPEGFLVPVDAKPDVRASLLSMRTLHDALIALPCRHLLLVLDCCFAGSFRWATTRSFKPVERKIHRHRYARFVADPAWQVLTSAAHDQEALDLGGLTKNHRDGRRGIGVGHSPFARALLEGLAGAADLSGPDGERDGVITTSELYLYLREQVETDGYGLRQTPGLWPLRKHGRGEFLFHVPGQAPTLAPDPVLDAAANPWRGLSAYGPDDAALFFGREAVVEALRARVEAGGLTILLAASGAGKSSLLGAGVVPWLRARAEAGLHGPLRPGADLDAAFEGFPGQVAPGAWVLIDQAEEVFTQSRDPEARTRFFAQLDEWVSSGVHVILAARIEFESQLAATVLGPRLAEARFVIPPPTPDELRRIVEQPASARVLYLEPPSLVDQLVNEVVAMPGGLPLLSFTLSEMYRRYVARRSDDRALTAADYEAVGGVVGALRRRASELHDQADAAGRQTVRRLFLRLTAVEGGELGRRRASLAELTWRDPAENDRMRRIVERFTEARLLVRAAGGVEPAHDVLVLAWDQVHTWLDAAPTLQLQRAAWREASAWRASGHDPALLWDADPRLEAVAALGDELNAREADFIDQSLARRRRRRWIRVGVIASVVAILAAAAVISFGLYRQAEESNRAAQQSFREAQGKRAADQHRLALEAAARGAWHDATDHAEQAAEAGDDPRYTAHLDTLRARQLITPPQSEGRARFATMGKAGDRFLILDRAGTISVRSIKGGQRLALPAELSDARIIAADGRFTEPALSDDDRRAAVRLADGRLVAWDILDRRILSVDGPDARAIEDHGSLAFGPGAGRVLTLRVGRRYWFWEIDGAQQAPLRVEGPAPVVGVLATKVIEPSGQVLGLWDASLDIRANLAPRCAVKASLSLLGDNALLAHQVPAPGEEHCTMAAGLAMSLLSGKEQLDVADFPADHGGAHPEVKIFAAKRTPHWLGAQVLTMEAPGAMDRLTLGPAPGADETTVTWWESDRNEAWSRRIVVRSDVPFLQIGFLGAERHFFTLTREGELDIWHADHRVRVRPVLRVADRVAQALSTSDGKGLVALDADGRFSIWSLMPPQAPSEVTLGGPIQDAVVAEDGGVWALRGAALVRQRDDRSVEIVANGLPADARLALDGSHGCVVAAPAPGEEGAHVLRRFQARERASVPVSLPGRLAEVARRLDDGHLVVLTLHDDAIPGVAVGLGLNRKTHTSRVDLATGDAAHCADADGLSRDGKTFRRDADPIEDEWADSYWSTSDCAPVSPPASEMPGQPARWMARFPADDRDGGELVDANNGLALLLHQRKHGPGDIVRWLRVWDARHGVPVSERLGVGEALVASGLGEAGEVVVAVTADGRALRWRWRVAPVTTLRSDDAPPHLPQR